MDAIIHGLSWRILCGLKLRWISMSRCFCYHQNEFRARCIPYDCLCRHSNEEHSCCSFPWWMLVYEITFCFRRIHSFNVDSCWVLFRILCICKMGLCYLSCILSSTYSSGGIQNKLSPCLQLWKRRWSRVFCHHTNFSYSFNKHRQHNNRSLRIHLVLRMRRQRYTPLHYNRCRSCFQWSHLPQNKRRRLYSDIFYRPLVRAVSLMVSHGFRPWY